MIDPTEAFFGVANGITSFAVAQTLAFFYALGTSERFEGIIAKDPRIYFGIFLGNSVYMVGLLICIAFITCYGSDVSPSLYYWIFLEIALILFLMTLVLEVVRRIKANKTAKAKLN